MSARLKVLVENGIVQSTPAPNATYELTTFGEQLRAPLLALGIWGLNLPVDVRIDPSSTRAELIALSLTGISTSGTRNDISAVCEFHVDDEVFHMRVKGGEATTHSGQASQSDAIVQCDPETFMALALQQISPHDAMQQGRVYIKSGQARIFEQLFEALQYSPEKYPFPLLNTPSHSSLAGTPDES